MGMDGSRDVGLREVPQNAQQDRQRGQTLLPIHHIGRWILRVLDEDDAAEKIGAGVSDRSRFEACGFHILQQFSRLLRRPGVWPLIGRNPKDVLVAKNVEQRLLAGLDRVSGHTRNTRIASSP